MCEQRDHHQHSPRPVLRPWLTVLFLMSQSGALSDVTFKVGAETFQAHKQILAGRSPVFCAMFKAGGVEATTGEITVEDIDPVAFKQATILPQ